MLEYPKELKCFKNGKEMKTRLVNPYGGVRLYSHREGELHIDSIGGKYGVSYLSNKHPFTYRSKLLKDWKLKRSILQQLDHSDIIRHNWELVKVDDVVYVQIGNDVSIYDKTAKRKKFAICPTFIYNWCKIYYRTMRGFHHIPKSIKGKNFLQKFRETLEYVKKNNHKYKLLDEDFKRLMNYYYEMKKHGYLKGRYPIKLKMKLY